MDSTAPPPDQVRPTQVVGGEIPDKITVKPSEQSPIKGMKKTENSATLIERKDGSTRLIYSTKKDIKYDTFDVRKLMSPVPTDFDMMGLKRSQWQQLLSADSTIRTALTYNPETEFDQRMHSLNQVRKEELMYALRQLEDPNQQQDIYKGKCYADFLTVQISDGNGTHNEQLALCSAVHLTDLKCIREEDSADLGFGIFRLSKPRKIAILPGFDRASLFQDMPSRERLPIGYREFLMAYLDVETDAEFIALQNEMPRALRLRGTRRSNNNKQERNYTTTTLLYIC